MKIKSPLLYTIYSIIGTILEEALLVVIVLWVLPHFNIRIPWWGLAVLAVALAAYACFTYRLGIRALVKKPTIAPDSIIGTEGKVVRPLAPEGLVKVHGELWRAHCDKWELEAGDEVVVVGIDGLKLIVVPKTKGVQYQQVRR